MEQGGNDFMLIRLSALAGTLLLFLAVSPDVVRPIRSKHVPSVPNFSPGISVCMALPKTGPSMTKEGSRMRKRHQSANYKRPSGLHWPATEFANDNVSRLASRPGAERQAEPPILPRDGAESDRWSPSQEELDAYIDSLEWELSREYPLILRPQGE